jgi:hypothetical protein
MPSPFPGMDPYLEEPHGWLGFHNSFVVTLGYALNDVLPQQYRAEVDQRVMLVEDRTPARSSRPDVSIVGPAGPPISSAGQGDVALLERPETVTLPLVEWINEWFLEVRDDQGVVVTVVEVLSPTNKSDSDGRRQYEDKRKRILASETNLVEIDLLRQGRRFVDRENGKPFDYCVLVVRGDLRLQADLLPFSIRQRIPRFVLPLKPREQGPIVDLNAVFSETFDRGRYAHRFNYRLEPDPQLNAEDAVWADALLREKGLR